METTFFALAKATKSSFRKIYRRQRQKYFYFTSVSHFFPVSSFQKPNIFYCLKKLRFSKKRRGKNFSTVLQQNTYQSLLTRVVIHSDLFPYNFLGYEFLTLLVCSPAVLTFYYIIKNFGVLYWTVLSKKVLRYASRVRATEIKLILLSRVICFYALKRKEENYK